MDPPSQQPEPNKHDRRAEATKARICRAVVEILDTEGYSETSINRVQKLAGVSRGALTHHFPTKQALVSETAVRLLEAAIAPLTRRTETDQAARPRPVDDLLTHTWANVVNTCEGRAFLEILVACRTDPALLAVLQDKLQEWDSRSSEAIQQIYTGSGAQPDDAALVWSICRTFLRGLLVHGQFVQDPAYLARMMDRFAGIMKDHLLVPPGPDEP